MSKLTKIVATIGPVTDSEEMLTQLVKAGMNVARFNTKHGTSEWHAERIDRVQRVSAKLGTPVAVLLDLQGPEIRANLANENSFEMKEGDTAFFSANESLNQTNLVFVPQEVVDAVSEGSLVSMEDGLCEFIVSKKHADHFEVIAQGDFTVKHRKTVNTPGTIIDMPSLIPTDLEKLIAVKDKNIEFVALSFVRNKEDIEALRSELKQHGMTANIVAKIENQAAVDSFEEILAASDAIMVARGDLGVEVPFQELIYWQRHIIDRCRQVGKPVITATQMLKSMVDSPLPTRAEVSDVAHAIYDGTDAVMLSEESTIGQFPVKAVEVQASIAEFNEPYAHLTLQQLVLDDKSEVITDAARDILELGSLRFDKVIVLTETGRTAQLFSRFRIPTEIIAVTRTTHTANKLALVYGVSSVVIEFEAEKLDSLDYITSKLAAAGVVGKGEKALLIHGPSWGHPGKIGSLSVIEIS